MFLIQSYGGATIHAFKSRRRRDAKLRELRNKHTKTIYTKKDI